jgi:hypothetical protein
MSKENEAWAFWANTKGPWFNTPQRVKRRSITLGWWRSCGNCDVQKMGLDEDTEHGYLTFASHDKAEVQKFINGFMAARRCMAPFFK